MFPSVAPREDIEILGTQNELFPSGPVIKCLLYSQTRVLLKLGKTARGKFVTLIEICVHLIRAPLAMSEIIHRAFSFLFILN